MTGKITGTSHCALCDITNTTTGRKDNLRGLKENVVVGRLIPAGTGLAMMKEEKIEEEVESIDLDEALSQALSEEEID